MHAIGCEPVLTPQPFQKRTVCQIWEQQVIRGKTGTESLRERQRLAR